MTSMTITVTVRITLVVEIVKIALLTTARIVQPLKWVCVKYAMDSILLMNLESVVSLHSNIYKYYYRII